MSQGNITYSGVPSGFADLDKYTSGFQKGDLFYHDGEKLVRLPKGNPGQTLTVGTDGTPEWQ